MGEMPIPDSAYASMASSEAHAAKGEIATLREAVIGLVNTLADRGSITRDEADTFIRHVSQRRR